MYVCIHWCSQYQESANNEQLPPPRWSWLLSAIVSEHLRKISLIVHWFSFSSLRTLVTQTTKGKFMANAATFFPGRPSMSPIMTVDQVTMHAHAFQNRNLKVHRLELASTLWMVCGLPQSFSPFEFLLLLLLDAWILPRVTTNITCGTLPT